MPGQSQVRSGNLAGLALFATSLFLISTSDALAKLLTETLHPLQVVWMRQSGLAMAALGVLAIRGPGVLRTGLPQLQVLRGLAAALSALCFITALRFVPLADAVAVSFVAPFLVTAMGAAFLGETVTWRRWAAVLGGFTGALIIIRPGFGVVSPAILLVLAGAFFLALRQILGRRLAARDPISTTLVWTALTGFALLSCCMPAVWTWPDAPIWTTGMCIAALIAASEFLLIQAFATAEATAIAPALYSAMIWATLYGWLVFGQLPDLWTWIGSAIILATGFYLIVLEMRAGRGSR
ncbi:S-adenosylmethionine uptake transporter [Aliiruegeria haliotis]|uniref:S-adenosylmethionine uptake transporter n=1 Tax=Aliiruegeria haliotis TaxID=1280846 RepID=A0A2T0RMB2_9RHOB|nr:DMT family transporter [Aliiruegeria haliotis]PRY22270.1 S-adenosylmethionine uptake transporter [Aliiruegeria haliotis]